MSQKKRILFVCTGNACRSPMAEVIFKRMLDNTGINNVEVRSAGTFAVPGSPACGDSRAVISELFGEDVLDSHVRTQLVQQLTDWADLIVVMEDAHKDFCPDGNTSTLRELSGSFGDIDDPIHTGIEGHRRCRDEIVDCLERAFEKIVS